MPKIRTLYDELNVARDASDEEIKHAFRKLAQQLHPDRNHASNASDLMAVVNAAHDVLANPARRAAYDASLISAAQKARQAATQRRQAGPARPAAQPARTAKKPSAKSKKPARRGSCWRWAAVFIVACGAGAWMGYEREPLPPFVPAVAQDHPLVAQAQVKPKVVLPAAELPVSPPVKATEPGESECALAPLDPLGAPWPEKAGYIPGLPMLRDGGWSEIVVDNTAGEQAVYAKVTDASGKREYRHAYVPARSRFTFGRMDVGYYQLKYKMLDTGCAYASSRIRLEETLEGNRIKSSTYKLTLRKLQGRNSPVSTVRRGEF